MDDSVRKAKEAFVTGHNGGDIYSISLLVVSTGLSTITSQLLLTYKLPKLIYHALDLIVMFLFPLLTCLYTEHITYVLVAQLWLLLLLFVNYPFFSFHCPDITDRETAEKVNSQYRHTSADVPQCLELASPPTYSWLKHVIVFRIPSISRLRTSLFILTAICILAVDFHIFPRSNAKTEEYGTGLMDIGVGGFLFCNALVHPLTRTGLVPKVLEKTSFYSIVIKPVRGVLPLIVIGLLRLVVLSFVNYQSHLTEYGVHWNFFFSLASVMVLCSLFHYFIFSITAVTPDAPNNTNTNTNIITTNNDQPELPTSTTIFPQYQNAPKLPSQEPSLYIYSAIFIAFCFILGFGLLAYYNHLLSSPYPYPLAEEYKSYYIKLHKSLNAAAAPLTYRDWIFGNDREGVVAQNKEGLYSLYGYFALAIISIGFGRLLNIIQYLFIARHNRDQELRRHQPQQPQQPQHTHNMEHTLDDGDEPESEIEFIAQTQMQMVISRIHVCVTASLTVLFWVLTEYTRLNYDDISRRLCNISFCYWILHIACLLLTLCIIPDILLYFRVNPSKARRHRRCNGLNNNNININNKNNDTAQLNLQNKHTDPWNYHLDKALAAAASTTTTTTATTISSRPANDPNNNNNNNIESEQQPQSRPITRSISISSKYHQSKDSSLPNIFDPVLPPQPRLVRPKHRETIHVNAALHEKYSKRLSLRPNVNVAASTTQPHAHPHPQLSFIEIAFPATIIDGVNSNALKYFLVTNACTGTINMLLVTMDASDTLAFIVLCLYLVISYSISWLPLLDIFTHCKFHFLSDNQHPLVDIAASSSASSKSD